MAKWTMDDCDLTDPDGEVERLRARIRELEAQLAKADALTAAGFAEYERRLAALDPTPDPRVAALVESCKAWGMHTAPEDATAADPFRDIRAALAAFKE